MKSLLSLVALALLGVTADAQCSGCGTTSVRSRNVTVVKHQLAPAKVAYVAPAPVIVQVQAPVAPKPMAAPPTVAVAPAPVVTKTTTTTTTSMPMPMAGPGNVAVVRATPVRDVVGLVVGFRPFARVRTSVHALFGCGG